VLLNPSPANSAIVDTVAAVFSDSAFSAHQHLSLWEIAIRWIGGLLGRLAAALARHPAVAEVIRWGILIALVLVVGRMIYTSFWRRTLRPSGYGPRTRAGDGEWWAIAQRLAAEGRYTDAAHALYAALIAAATRQGLVSPHESKTTGDYLREFRRSGAPASLPAFTDFTRSYETVIYGIGSCDSERYTYLSSLAGPLLGTLHGART
jgi:hypothetical protein